MKRGTGWVVGLLALMTVRPLAAAESNGVAVDGGTPGGIATAVAAAHAGAHVVLTEPTNPVGGLNPGGLNTFELEHRIGAAVTGFPREFSRGGGTLQHVDPTKLRAVLVQQGALPEQEAVTPGLRLSWEKDILTIRGAHLPGGRVQVWYLEAFCRPGSHDRDWKQTVITHTTRLIEASPVGKTLRLRSTLADGVLVDHEIRAQDEEVDFRVVATNPTREASAAHWAQPCIRVADFTGVAPEPNSEAYLPHCFLFFDGKLTRLPTQPWATEARYTPGQVWCPAHVDRADVNPRPLSPLVPSSGLIGCFSGDGRMILATAWEPYQELFQGVITCLHSDFRIGGLSPGETKHIRGKIYLTPADVPALVRRYEADFPERQPGRR